MTNTKLTKRALLASVLSLLLCISMLVSSTFAWFTDSATTGVGNIVAGTLDIDLVDKAGESLVGEGKSISFVDKDGKEISNILWEPGCSYLLEEVKLVNKGNLYAKCKLVITAVNGATDGDVDQANVIDVYEGTERIGTLREILNRADAVKSDIILAPAGKDGSEVAFGQLKLVMQETAGNEYQGKSLTGITVTVLATQYTAEYDSEDNQYDAGALYPDEKAKVTNDDELTAAMASKEGYVVAASSLTKNIVADSVKVTVEDAKMDKSHFISKNGGELVVENASNIKKTNAAFLFMADNATVTIEDGIYEFSSLLAANTPNNTSVVNINGGTFKGSSLAWPMYPVTTVNITGGTFDLKWLIMSPGDEKLTITGGTFNVDPSSYVPEGYKVITEVKENITWYSVVEAVEMTVTNNDELTAAIEAKVDYTVNDGTYSKTVVADAAEVTVEGGTFSNQIIAARNGGTVTIKNASGRTGNSGQAVIANVNSGSTVIFEGGNYPLFNSLLSGDGTGTVIIKGGYFDGGCFYWSMGAKPVANLTITGGTFGPNFMYMAGMMGPSLSEFVPDTHQIVNNADGSCTVVAK